MTAVNHLYNSYAAMLLGYIFKVVKNQPVAEQYLVLVFNDVPDELDELYKPGVNAFCHLQLMARKKLTSFFESTNEGTNEETSQKDPFISKNRFLNLMNQEQQLVFCGAHWQGKTTAKLAAELNRPDDEIRKILKECFTIIRSCR